MRRLRDLRGRHALAAVWLAGVLDAAMPVAARDLGVLGETWRIAEADLLEQIEQQLAELERSGERARLDEEAKARARERLEEPEPVPGIQPARVSRTWLFDPAITVQENILGPDGTMIAAAGTRIEPLAHRGLLTELLFIDGTRDVEVDWALARVAPTTIVLLAGRPFDLARSHGRAFYFDRTGALTERFGLKATPTRIRQEGLKLRVTEVPLDENGQEIPLHENTLRDSLSNEDLNP